MHTGDKALRDRLLAMSPEQVRDYWKQEQRRRREAGEPYKTTLYAAVTGPDADKVVARIDDDA